MKRLFTIHSAVALTMSLFAGEIHLVPAAFLAQKDTAGGIRTMNAYLWKVCGDAYDANH